MLNKVKMLREKRNDLVSELNDMLQNVTETRSLNNEQTEKVHQLEKQIDELTIKIQTTEEEMRSNVVEENIKTEGEMKMSKELNEIRAIENFIKNGVVAEEIRATNTSANNTAIQPVYVHNEIVRKLEEVAPIFSKAKQYQATAGELKIPRESASNLWEYGFVGEDAEVSEHALSFDTVSLKQVRVGASVKVTQHLLNDVEMDIVGYVVDMLARRLGATLDHHCVVGSGVQGEDLQGLANLTKDDHGINEVEATAVDSDVLLDAIHAMHPALLDGAEFIVSRATYNAIAKLKDASGQYILKLERSVAPEAPQYRAFGFPITVTEDVEDNRIYFVNIGRAFATMVKKGSQIVRISNDTQNALRGTHTFVIDAYVDFRLRDPQAVVTVKVNG